MSKVWLVTGSASGLGRNIAEAVLASGARLVATARDPRRLEDLVQKYGDKVRAAPLDVTDERAAHAAVKVALDAFGQLDVVVTSGRPLAGSLPDGAKFWPKPWAPLDILREAEIAQAIGPAALG